MQLLAVCLGAELVQDIPTEIEDSLARLMHNGVLERLADVA
ncbi:hypothetical protein [Mesorhizobium sp. M0816]